ncbi:MAG: restriction endonuclease subunit S [Methyloglobulus sp.]|nr:restriction endonuclease subunit S [Methyloglobulus sp.]
MTPTQLLQHFDRLSEAPDAIPRLRRFILDLAVRGKLVEQDLNDEPAAELLKRIKIEKARLVKEGQGKKEKPLAPIEEEETPFLVPASWIWTRLQDITSYIQRGKSPIYASEDGLPVISQKCVQWKGLDISSARLITRESIKKYDEVRFLRENDLLWNSTGTGTIGRVVRVISPPQNLVCDSHVTVVRCALANAEYIRSWLRSDHIYQLIEDRAAGSTNQVELTSQMTTFQVVPLPPLAEQHRIVAKVDELMALCDQLEAAKAEREQSRGRLLAANLHHLNQPAEDEEAFREHVRFTFNHLPRITTRPAHIKQMRQTILNLAMCGKLVAQNPNDEPASEFLKRIHAEKVRLEKEGKTKRDKPVEAVEADTAPFAIPEIWNWARLGDLTELITKGSSPKWQGITYVSKEDGILFVTSENVGNYHLRKLDELKYVDKRFNEIEPRSILRYGDILMNLVGASIGRTAIYDLSEIANINQAVALIRLIQSTANMEPEFMLHYFNSPSAIQIMLTSQVITAQPNISLTNAREFPIPVPPLAEQRRIVAKVNELMTLCAQLETQLDTTETDSRHLLEAVLHNALSPLALR